MKQIGKALVKSLIQAEVIETNPCQLKVVARQQEYGLVSCSLKGATTRERSIFLEALQEVLGPIENPRYVLVRKSPLGWLCERLSRSPTPPQNKLPHFRDGRFGPTQPTPNARAQLPAAAPPMAKASRTSRTPPVLAIGPSRRL
jgi:hypothetical protein